MACHQDAQAKTHVVVTSTDECRLSGEVFERQLLPGSMEWKRDLEIDGVFVIFTPFTNIQVVHMRESQKAFLQAPAPQRAVCEAHTFQAVLLGRTYSFPASTFTCTHFTLSPFLLWGGGVSSFLHP